MQFIIEYASNGMDDSCVQIVTSSLLKSARNM